MALPDLLPSFELTTEQVYRKLWSNESFIDIIDLQKLVQSTNHKLSNIGRMIANNTTAYYFAVHSMFPDIKSLDFEHVIHGLDRNVSITKISLSFRPDTSTMDHSSLCTRLLTLLSNMQNKFQYIKTVSIYFNQVQIRDFTYPMKTPLEKFLMSMSKVETLRFSVVDPESVPTLMGMLPTLSNLHTLKIDIFTQFNEPQLASVFECVDMMPQLTRLELDNHLSTQAVIEYIFEWITNNTTITHFLMPHMQTRTVSYMDPPARDISELLGALTTKLIATNTTLKKINIKYELSTIDWSQIHKDSKLESFVFPWKRIRGSSAPKLLELLKTNTIITEYAYSYNNSDGHPNAYNPILSLLKSGRPFTGLYLEFDLFRATKEEKTNLLNIVCEYINTTPDLYKLCLHLHGIFTRPMFEKLIDTIAKNMFLTELSLTAHAEMLPNDTRFTTEYYLQSMCARIYETNINLTTLDIQFNHRTTLCKPLADFIAYRNKRLTSSLSSLLLPSSIDF